MGEWIRMTWEEISKELFEEKTEKRFTDDGIEEIEDQSFTDNLTEKTYWIDNGLDEIVELLNALHEENIKVSSLIDKKIDDLQRIYDFGQEQGFCPMHNIMHSINVLKEIKKEMGWE